MTEQVQTTSRGYHQGTIECIRCHRNSSAVSESYDRISELDGLTSGTVSTVLGTESLLVCVCFFKRDWTPECPITSLFHENRYLSSYHDSRLSSGDGGSRSTPPLWTLPEDLVSRPSSTCSKSLIYHVDPSSRYPDPLPHSDPGLRPMVQFLTPDLGLPSPPLTSTKLSFNYPRSSFRFPYLGPYPVNSGSNSPHL